MNKRFLIFWVLFLAIFISGFAVFYPLTTKALPTDTLKGLDQSIEGVPAYKDPVIDNNFIQNQVGEIISLVLSFVGVLFFILVIYAGILWMTSQGNDQQVTKAKDLLTSAIIGLIITLAAYAITSFIGTEILS